MRACVRACAESLKKDLQAEREKRTQQAISLADAVKAKERAAYVSGPLYPGEGVEEGSGWVGGSPKGPWLCGGDGADKTRGKCVPL